MANMNNNVKVNTETGTTTSIKWRAFDGTVFDSREECLEYTRACRE
jgi:hypothetical protein